MGEARVTLTAVVRALVPVDRERVSIGSGDACCDARQSDDSGENKRFHDKSPRVGLNVEVLHLLGGEAVVLTDRRFHDANVPEP